MKEILILTEAQTKALQNALNLLNVPVEPIKINNILQLFMSDEMVLYHLKMSKKSLYNYRKEGYLSQIHLPGRSYSYLPYLIQDLLELNEKKVRRRKRE